MTATPAKPRRKPASKPEPDAGQGEPALHTVDAAYEAQRAALAETVAQLEPGMPVRAKFHTLDRPEFTVESVLALDSDGTLFVGCWWERVRLADGKPPAYLRAVEVLPYPLIVAEPGLVYDMPEALYHSGPTPTESLSQSGAKLLLAPSAPAKFRHDRDNGRKSTRAFDFGHAAHAHVLGVGAPVRKVYARDWRTKAAQEERDAAYREGLTPLLAHEAEAAEAMAAALLDDPDAGPLFTSPGASEVSLFGVDPRTGVWVRGRVDRMEERPGGRVRFVDYKTTTGAHADPFNRSVERYGYAMQAAWYLDLGAQLDDCPDPEAFVFVAQEKEPPYLVSVFDLDDDWLAIGRELNRQALDLFARCLESGDWPGYGRGIQTLSPPAWLRSRVLPNAATPVPIDPEFEAMLARMAGLSE